MCVFVPKGGLQSLEWFVEPSQVEESGLNILVQSYRTLWTFDRRIRGVKTINIRGKSLRAEEHIEKKILESVIRKFKIFRKATPWPQTAETVAARDREEK